MQSIRSALDRIIVVQAALAITDPTAVSVKKAYKYGPKQDTIFPDVPCWMNGWTLVSERRINNQRISHYEVHMQLFVEDADLDRAADIASEFMAKTLDAFDQDVTLEGACDNQTVRGGAPTLAVLTRAKRDYIGLDLFMDVRMHEDFPAGFAR